MAKVVFIGAGSGFGAKTIADILSFEELRDGEIVLVDINPDHLEPVAAYARKVAEHYDAPAKISTALDWRGGALDGADYVITSFAHGGPAYGSEVFHHEMCIPQEYGIYQSIGDTAGVGGVFRMMRTAGEMVAIGLDMEKRCPGAWMLNYVNPMAMLTRIVTLACPGIHVLGLCHNIQFAIRDLSRWLECPYKQLRYEAAGVNHMDWFLRLEYLDGRDAYPDLKRAAAEGGEFARQRPVHTHLLRELGYWTTESAWHCSEYLPYFVPRAADREAVGLEIASPPIHTGKVSKRWGPDSPLVQQLRGEVPMKFDRGFEYGAHIIHALETDNVYRMNLNVLNRGMIENLPDGCCVEVPCVADRTGVRAGHVGALPIHLAALCRGMADMQTLAADAFLERDLEKACLACIIDPCTAACATPAKIRECFNKLLEAERDWLKDAGWPLP